MKSLSLVILSVLATTFAKPHALQNDDGRLVARLDTEYQEAVKKNDVATMDRILADDFVLVTGKGRIFTKADLLQEARKGNVV